MTWRSFCEYLVYKQLGHTDTIMRNYDLEDLNGSKSGILLDRGALRMGLDQKNMHRSLLLPAISQMLVNVGYVPPAPAELHGLVIEWYNWDRILKGEIISWKRLQLKNPLI
jgi:hypothetical protein